LANICNKLNNYFAKRAEELLPTSVLRDAADAAFAAA
jgi:hypothetical protein